MPFKECNRMEERIALMRAYDSGAYSVGQLCEQWGVSRETFYVWRRRRDSGDERWFEDRSRAPNRCPHATPREVVAKVVALKKRFPHFGPKKIRARLALDEPGLAVPATSTIGGVLKRHGLVQSKPRRSWRISRFHVVES